MAAATFLQTVLDGMTFRVEAGKVAALVGKSGGGKSTMIHLMLRFYDPQGGRITIGGVDYRELSLASVHRNVGVVSQVTQLFTYDLGEADL
jgi:ATP-binding cassette subfamily B protein